MTIASIFNIGNSALIASQTALSVTSNNIANINTPGYSKEDVVLSLTNPISSGNVLVGNGVTVNSVKRSYDRFLQAQLLGQGQNQGKSAAMDQTWGQIEPIFNETQGIGLSTALSDYFNAWSDVANDPSSPLQRNVLLQKAGSLTVAAQGMERSVLDTLKNANTDITGAVTQINSLATDIGQLNNQIIQQEAGVTVGTANDLRDQRDQKLTELSKLVDFSSYEDKNGSITVTIGMRNLVSGVTTNPLSSVKNSEGNQDLYLDGINITGTIQKGQIGGLIAARNDIQSKTLLGLRQLVASITQQVNQLHQTGFGLDGSTGNNFFAPLQLTTTDNSPGANITAATITNQNALTLDEYNITFNGAGPYTYSVNSKQSGALVAGPTAYDPLGTTITLPGMSVTISGAVTAADSFTVSPLTSAIGNFNVAITDPQKIAASTTAAGIPGSNVNALQIANLTNLSQSGLGNTTFSNYYGNLVGSIGSAKKSAADSLTFDNNLQSALQARRDSVSGVSLDEEAANLVRYQRSYEAGARLITVADQLMQTVLHLGL